MRKCKCALVDFVTGKIGLVPAAAGFDATMSGAAEWGYLEGCRVKFDWMTHRRFKIGQRYFFQTANAITFAECTDLSTDLIGIERPDYAAEYLKRSGIVRAAVPFGIWQPAPVMHITILNPDGTPRDMQ